MGHQHIQNPLRFAAVVIACSTGISFGVGAAPAGAAGGGGGGGGGHAAATPAATPSAAPAAPARATPAPTVNPTTPAGTSNASHNVQNQQTPQANAAATDNGASHAHRHENRDPQYQTMSGNFWFPDEQWYGQYGNNGNAITPNNNNSSAFDNSGAAQPAPTPAPVAPTDNSTSIAAQADNAVNRSPAMVSAGDEIQRAQSAYQADRERVIAQLADKSDYKQAVARKQEASKNMSDVKPLGAGKPENQVMDTASQKLDASDDVTKMQEAAIAADPQAAADKDRLTKLISARDAKAAQLRK